MNNTANSCFDLRNPYICAWLSTLSASHWTGESVTNYLWLRQKPRSTYTNVTYRLLIEIMYSSWNYSFEICNSALIAITQIERLIYSMNDCVLSIEELRTDCNSPVYLLFRWMQQIPFLIFNSADWKQISTVAGALINHVHCFCFLTKTLCKYVDWIFVYANIQLGFHKNLRGFKTCFLVPLRFFVTKLSQKLNTKRI